MRQQPKRAGATRQLYQFYLKPSQRAIVDSVRGAVSFSAYVASAVLKEAERDGATFHGDVRGGACARSAPDRQVPCTTGLPAVWWNRFGLAFFCESCATQLNAMEPGICLSPEDQKARGVAIPETEAE